MGKRDLKNLKRLEGLEGFKGLKGDLKRELKKRLRKGLRGLEEASRGRFRGLLKEIWRLKTYNSKEPPLFAFLMAHFCISNL